MIFNKFFVAIICLSFTLLNALSLYEMPMQDEVPPSFDCSKLTLDDDEIELVLCNKIELMNNYENKLSAIMDNFYSSYYKILMQHINTQDKNKIRNIARNMIKNRSKCKESSDHVAEILTEDDNPIIPSLNLTDCIQDEYFKSFKQLTDFIYNNPQYKHIFDKIFAPNAKEYYELIKSSKDLRKIIDKAAGEGLIDNVGKLIEK